MKSYSQIPSNKGKILALTYNSEMSEDFILEAIKSFNGVLIFLDRFDLYYSRVIIDALLSKNVTALIDLKNVLLANTFPCKLACIDRLSANEIEVSNL